MSFSFSRTIERTVPLIVIGTYPFLRYKMHAYGLEAAQMTSLYDRLQDIHKINGFPLDVDDLPLSHNVEKVYTPFGITLIKEDQPFGEIRFNAFGFAEQMYLMTDPYRQILFFDDRGFISAKSLQTDNGEQVRGFTITNREWKNVWNTLEKIRMLS